ncbi:hypothetical protein EV138_3752 [Kribbella voronezhensis]|uniref:Uncharacterized protein n=1 Tax=Kribbella voronezhensis TaxID=2512212 RepID=A0A4R7TFH6_9ACTN|nr:hypothetical protein [Kribbella voronezhensis]TDU90167.1 hypothetical protein EV138_3752 [Kribbella voronezhensis]
MPDLRVLRPLITATVALTLLAGCGGGDDNDKATDKPSDGGSSASEDPSGPALATFDQPKAFAPVAALAKGGVAGMPNLYYTEAGMVGKTALYGLRTGLAGNTLDANSWEVPSAKDSTTKTTDLTAPMAVQLDGKEVVAIAYKQVVEGGGTQKSHDQVSFQWIDPAEGDVLATAVADLSTLLGPGNSSSGLGNPAYDPATGQIVVSLQAQYDEAAPSKVRDFSVFADPATKKATTIPAIRAAGVLNGVVVGVKGSQQEGAKDNAIVQADGVTGAVKKTVPVPAMNYLTPTGSGGKHAYFAGTGSVAGAKDDADHANAIYAADIATGEVVENKLPPSGDSNEATCFSDHVAAVVCNRSLGDQKTAISGFDDATGKLAWGYDSSSNRLVPKITTIYNGLVYGQADSQPAILDAKTGQDVVVPSATPSATPTAGTTPDDTSSSGIGNVGGWGDTSLLSGNQLSPVMVSKYGSVYLQEPGNKATLTTEKILVVQKAIG